MDDITRKTVLEVITPCLTDRLGRTYLEDKEYQESVKKADLIFEKLDAALTKNQAELLEEYFIANNATVAIMEKLIHRQGMRDMLDFLISLLKDAKNM